MGYSLFQTSTLGMMSQAHALDTLGTNIANVNTGGFKRTDTRFSTVLGGNIRTGAGSNSTISYASPNGASGGIKPKDFQTLDQQGLLKATTRDLDLAIAGDGFFLVSPTLQVSNQILYTRDGSFDINVAGAPVTAIGDDGNTINVRQGFLTDKNGFFLLGVPPQADGTFSGTGALQALRVDQFAFTNSFTPTTVANVSVNLPAQNKF
ncbi:MAG: flagellar hook-basal body complex protein, partial [Rhodospirillales bacterium]